MRGRLTLYQLLLLLLLLLGECRVRLLLGDRQALWLLLLVVRRVWRLLLLSDRHAWRLLLLSDRHAWRLLLLGVRRVGLLLLLLLRVRSFLSTIFQFLGVLGAYKIMRGRQRRTMMPGIRKGMSARRAG